MDKRHSIARRAASLLLAMALFICAVPSAFADFSAYVTASSMSVYSDSALTQKIGSLPKNTIVVVTGYSGSVAQIRYKGRSGYSQVSDMERVDRVADLAVVNKTTLVYKKANKSSASTTIKKGLKVYILEIRGDWAMIEKGGVVGYTYAGYLTVTETADTEATPAPTSQINDYDAATLASNARVAGWTASVSGQSLFFYKGASTSSSKISTLAWGTTVNVIKYDATWAYVELNGTYGYLQHAGLAKGGVSSTPAPTSSPTASPLQTPETSAGAVFPQDSIPAVVTADRVSVYKSASSSSTKLGTMKAGTEVAVLAYNRTWAYIELSGNRGFCALSALKKTETTPTATPGASIDLATPAPENPDGTFTATVIYPAAKVYSSASESAESVSLSLGTSVTVYGYDSSWAKVGIGDKRGYMLIKHLSKADYSPLEYGDSGDAVKKLQQMLLELGYFDGTPAGNYSTLTYSAVRRFQAACGLSDTGDMDTAALRILAGGYAPSSPLLSATLSSGNTSDSVTRMQTRLYYLGYLSKASSIDGEFGSISQSAVKLFQESAGLSATGTADSATLKAMYSTVAPSKPSGATSPDASSGSSSGSSGGSTSSTTDIPASLASTTTSYSSGMSNREKIEYVIYVAQNQLGKPYIYGTSGTKSYDCSGLTSYCFRQVGVSLGRSAYAQGYDGSYAKITSVSQLVRGDIICMNTISDSDQSDHVGIYLGNNYFIHASSGGGKVMISNISTGYYNRVFSWARRIL